MADIKPHILVVDDEPSIAKIVKKQLEVAGYQVTVAVDGAAGLAAAKELRPNLIILDNMLPKMTGPEICTALKQEESFKQTPILILSAKAQRADEEQALSCGADAYVVKPFQLEDLLGRIRTLLERPAPGA